MALAHQALRDHLQLLAKRGRSKTLAPDLLLERIDHIGAPVLRCERAVGFELTRQRRSVQPFVRHLLQGLLEGLELIPGHGAAGRHGMATKAQQHAGMALGHQIERIAQVKAGDRAARALELVGLALGAAGRKHKGRAVHLVLDARGHDAHHALVKVGLEDDHCRRGCVRVGPGIGDGHRLLAHMAFDVAAFAVDLVELLGQLQRPCGLVGEQAFDAQGHVRQTAGGIDARAQREAKVHAAGLRRLAFGHLEQRRQARRHVTGADALKALGHQPAVVRIQTHHIGHCAQRHQRQQRIELGLRRLRVQAAIAKLGPQGQQHIKHHADARDRFAGKGAAGLIGVDDHIGRRQRNTPLDLCGQVVIGHQNLQTELTGARHPLEAGDAVVHRHQHIGPFGFDPLGDGAGQAIAVDHPVGHQIAHPVKAQGLAEQAQPAHCHRAGGGAVAVVVGNDADVPALVHRIGQQACSLGAAEHLRGLDQAAELVVKLLGAVHTAGRIQLRQQGMDPGLLQSPDAAYRRLPHRKLHS